MYRLTHGHIRLGSPGCRNHRSRSGGQVSDDNNDTCLYGQTYAHMLYTLLSIIPPHRLDFITPRASSSALRHTGEDGERWVMTACQHSSFGGRLTPRPLYNIKSSCSIKSSCRVFYPVPCEVVIRHGNHVSHKYQVSLTFLCVAESLGSWFSHRVCACVSLAPAVQGCKPRWCRL